MTSDAKNPKDLMEYRHLGRTGLRVSVLSFGAWVNKLKSFDNRKHKCLYFCLGYIRQSNGCR